MHGFMGNDNPPRTLKTVERTVEVMKALKQLDGARVTELAEYLDTTPGTVYTHLATLRENRYVRKRNGVYMLSLHFLNMGEYVRNHHELYIAGKDATSQLAEKTGETAHLMAEEFGLGIYLFRETNQTDIVRDFFARKTERPDYLHLSSTGKAVLAHIPRRRVREIIDQHGLPARTEHTIADPDRLFEELDLIEEQGYALNDEEELRGARAVGAPIFDQRKEVIGAVSVSGPSGRIDDDRFYDELPDRICETANLIGMNLEVEGYQTLTDSGTQP